MTAALNNKRKRTGWWWKIPLGLLSLLLIGLVVVLLNINPIARTQISKALDRYLVAGGNLEAIDIGLMAGRVELTGLTINSPPNFGKQPLVTLDALAVEVAPLSIFSGKVVVEQVLLKGLSINIERDKKGRLSLMQLIPVTLPVPDSLPAGDKRAPDLPWIPTVHVNSIAVEDLSFRLTDQLISEQWSAAMHLDLAVEGLKIEDLFDRGILANSINLALRDIAVDQPPGFSQEPLLAISNIALASSGIDLGNSEVTVSDIMLDTLSVSLERNADREINMFKVVESWLPSAAEDKDDKPAPAALSAPADPSVPPFKLPTLIVENIQLKSITAQVLDSIEGQPWRAGFDGLDLQVTGVAVGDLTQQAISLASFDLDLKGIAVDQPPGFSTRKLFSLDHFTVVSEKSEVPSKELVIKQVSLEGLTSFITMRSDGLTNLEKLNEALRGSHVETQQNKKDTRAEAEPSTSTSSMPPVLFKQISMEGGPVTYRDEVFADEPLVATLKNIRMEVKGLRMFTDNPDVDPASASLSLELEQPGDLPTAYFGTLANVGPVGYGVPMVNTQVRLVGFKLDTLGSLVPPATRTTLGATGLDGGMALAMDTDSINLNASILTDRHVHYEGITVRGSLNDPVIKPGPVLTGVFSRVSDGLVNLGKSGLKSGAGIAKGAVDVTMELGSGAVSVGKNLGKSLFETVAGVVTLDKEKVKEGASGTTKGTVGLTEESIKGSSTAAGGSLKGSAAELSGKERVEAWDQDIPNRYQKFIQHAREALSEMPYPPVTK